MKTIGIALAVFVGFLLLTAACGVGYVIGSGRLEGLAVPRGGMMMPWHGWGGWFGTGRAGVENLEDAERTFERYVRDLGYDALHVTEVMEFQRNYYAIVSEDDTGIGAMELLIDKATGRVGPEPGPNMMWNTRYGMHGAGMGGWGRWGIDPGSEEMALSADQAEDRAQAWLDENDPGARTGEIDRFYGYYTLHVIRDGDITGMLSVHGETGAVWYHGWHGAFIAMTEHDDAP